MCVPVAIISFIIKEMYFDLVIINSYFLSHEFNEE